MAETILFTGLTGRTAPYLLKLMHQNSERFSACRLLAVIREHSDPKNIDESGLVIEKVVGDLTDETFLDGILPGVDTLMHIAGIHWSLPVVRAATKQGVRRIIAVHTTGIYSKYKDAGEEYRKIDAECERMAREAGTILTILRPTMIYGGLDDLNVIRFIRMVDRFPWIPVVSGGRYLLQPVNRRDLGRAYFDILTNQEPTDGKRYILSGEKPVELRAMLTDIAHLLGKPAKFFSIPFGLAFFCAWVLFVLSIEKIDIREKVQRLVEDRAYPHDAATKDFGFAPMPLLEGLKMEVAEYLNAKDCKHRKA